MNPLRRGHLSNVSPAPGLFSASAPLIQRGSHLLCLDSLWGTASHLMTPRGPWTRELRGGRIQNPRDGWTAASES